MNHLPASHRHIILPELRPEIEAVREEFEQLILPTWLLNAENVETVSRSRTHWVGNTPYMPATIGWPLCENCKQTLTFMWQINFGEFSGSCMFEEQGLLQFFYCYMCYPLPTSEEWVTEIDNNSEFYGGQLAVADNSLKGIGYRWYPDFQDIWISDPQIGCPDEEYIYGSDTPMQCVPEPALSLPDVKDKDYGLPEISADLDDSDVLYTRIIPEPERYPVSRLGGFPDWIQNDETPVCPECNQSAVFVAALGSGDTDILWGDTGYWYIFACKATPMCAGLKHPLSIHQCK